MKKFLLITAAMSCSIATALCQNNQPNNNTNSGYITYNKIEGGRPKIVRGVNNLVKLNPLLIINGDLPLYLEHKLKNKISLELSAGVTQRDFLFDLFYIDPDYNSIYMETITERRHLLGYSASASLRFYPSATTEALDGFFFAPEVRYRNYRSQALRCDATPNSLFNEDFIEEYRKLIDFKLTFGYITYINDRIIFEWYSGIGIRKRDISQAYCDQSGSTEETVLLYEQDYKPIFSTGFKLGFAF